MSPVHITSVTFEHHPSGFGVGHARPRISWRFSPGSADAKNWVQEYYEIQIGRQGPDKVEAISKCLVQGSNSVLVPSHALQSRESAWIRVKAHGKKLDTDGKETSESTEWSDAAVVEAALLEKQDWVAKLTASTLLSSNKEPIRPLLFRKSFSLPGNSAKVSKARLYIIAYGVYTAYLNGCRIGTEEMAPGWTSYGHRHAYQIFDVAEALKTKSSNVIGVEVAEGWFAGRLGMDSKRCFYGSRLAFIAQLEVVYETGEADTLISDNTWKSHHSAVIRSEIYDGEDYDSQEEQKDWTSDPAFDDESWKLTEELEFPSASLVASDSPPVRVMEEIVPFDIFKSKSGQTLVDFGQNLVGKLQVRLPISAPDGHKLSFSHAEVLEHGELGTRPLRGASPVDSVILSQRQPLTWSPKFTFHGFRYVQVDGWPDNGGLPGRDEITALVMHSDMKRTGWFSCSEPLINKLHQNTLWSMKGNFLSVPTDCPQRDERLGWTGDIQVFSPSANFLFDTSGFIGSWLSDVAAEQLEERRHGVPPLVVPDVFDIPACPPGPQSVWHDVTVLTSWDSYCSSGDVELLRRQYDSMKAWVDKGIPQGPDGLWDQNVWQFGDWLDPAAPPEEPGKGLTDGQLVADAYLIRVLETISKVSSLLGEEEDASRYVEEAARVRMAFQEEYTSNSGLVVSNTQTAYSLAILFDVFDRQDQIMKAASRLCHLVHAAKYRIATGFVGTPLITHALSNTSNHQLAYRMLLEQSCPSWLYLITMGATTIWERWDSMMPDGTINPGSMTSFNHYALGSVVNWLHEDVGGISPLEPGWRKIRIRPVPGGTITSAKVEYESVYGRIVSSWKIDETDGSFNLTVTVPPNSKAVVILPCEWKAVRQDEEGIEVGSGTYEYSCSYRPGEWPPMAEFERSTFRLEL
ncbi:glycoside hydrolase family 78 protein [Trichoderma austrokoningii]